MEREASGQAGRVKMWTKNGPCIYPEKTKTLNSKRYMHPNVHGSTTYSSQDMKATQVPINR